MVFHFVALGDDQEVCRSYRSSEVFVWRSCWKALLKRCLSLMRFSRHDLNKIITTDSLCGKKKLDPGSTNCLQVSDGRNDHMNEI